MTQNQDFIVVGLLGKTRGVQGEIWVTPLTDFPDRFIDLDEIHIQNRNIWEKTKIESADLISNRPVLKLAGINTREEAARLTNRRLGVPRDQVVGLPEDTYYVFDLIGLKVIDQASGERLGEVADVNSYPANDSYLIRLNNGTEKQLPAVDQYVKRVDLEKKELLIDPAGLI